MRPAIAKYLHLCDTFVLTSTSWQLLNVIGVNQQWTDYMVKMALFIK
jgi:hypothetical protein